MRRLLSAVFAAAPLGAALVRAAICVFGLCFAISSMLW
jgi:hypothetical protein